MIGPIAARMARSAIWQFIAMERRSDCGRAARENQNSALEFRKDLRACLNECSECADADQRRRPTDRHTRQVKLAVKGAVAFVVNRRVFLMICGLAGQCREAGVFGRVLRVVPPLDRARPQREIKQHHEDGGKPTQAPLMLPRFAPQVKCNGASNQRRGRGNFATRQPLLISDHSPASRAIFSLEAHQGYSGPGDSPGPIELPFLTHARLHYSDGH